jgi:predicted amidohydrolase
MSKWGICEKPSWHNGEGWNKEIPMKKTTGSFLLIWGAAILLLPSAICEPQSPKRNLVENPGFETLDPATRLPQGWMTVTPRQEIAPAFEVDSSVSHSGRSSARSTAKGSPGTFGFWVAKVKGIQEGVAAEDFGMSELTIRGADFLSARSYRVSCYFKASGIESPARSIWIRVNWLDGKEREVFTEFLTRSVKEGEWYRAEQVLTAPQAARCLSIELVLQWTPRGTVWWDDISVEEAPTPGPRRVRVATVYDEPPYRSTPEQNRKFYAGRIADAGKLGVDLLCLGEGITLVSTGRQYVDVAEPVPGPTSQILGEAARKSKLYVVAGIYEREGPLIYNTALLIDRDGNVAGKYRKTHLPETEVNGGLTPGSAYPVFRTDFGTVGLEICYDYAFPEVTRSLAVQGAEIVLLPIWGDLREHQSTWDVVARARAIDNAVYLVASIYSNRRSLIINPNGRILADTGGSQGLVTADIDLNARTFERWLSVGSYGEWKGLFPKERRTETYKVLVTSPSEAGP